MNGGTSGHANLLSSSKFNIILLEDNSNCYHRLHEGKLITYTFPWATAEGNIPAVPLSVITTMSLLAFLAMLHRIG